MFDELEGVLRQLLATLAETAASCIENDVSHVLNAGIMLDMLCSRYIDCFLIALSMVVVFSVYFADERVCLNALWYHVCVVVVAIDFAPVFTCVLCVCVSK